jgi:UTP--glucose-1-phosphate uridylyltransferase
LFDFSYYPPGHGDFYQSFYDSGVLDEMISEGRKICFMSNIDNMGATVDLNILAQCIINKNEFIMEVTEKTRADVKGGTLIQVEFWIGLQLLKQILPTQTLKVFHISFFKLTLIDYIYFLIKNFNRFFYNL